MIVQIFQALLLAGGTLGAPYLNEIHWRFSHATRLQVC